MEDLSQLILENKGKGDRCEGRNGGGKQTSGNSGGIMKRYINHFLLLFN